MLIELQDWCCISGAGAFRVGVARRCRFDQSWQSGSGDVEAGDLSSARKVKRSDRNDDRGDVLGEYCWSRAFAKPRRLPIHAKARFPVA